MLPDLLHLDGLLTGVYKDLAKPGVSQVGHAIGAVLGLGNTALWPIHLLNERARIALEANLDRYRKRLAETPVEDIVSVPPEIAVPVLERFSYVSDSTLSEMYAALLAQAARKDSQSNIHPNYVTILSSITPDEALLLQHILRSGSLGHAVQQVRANRTNVQMWRLKLRDLAVPLAFPQQIQLYLTNLSALGVIAGVSSAAMTKDVSFAPPDRSDVYTSISSVGGEITLTKFGQLFMQACVD